MNAPRPSSTVPCGFTLVEMSLVIGILLALTGTSFVAHRKITDWQRGREASETLRAVYTAQRMYLADNPTVAVSVITQANIIPYLPNRATTMPRVTSLTGATLNIRVNVSPPVVDAGGGTTYDPSGKPNDSLWDVGE